MGNIYVGGNSVYTRNYCHCLDVIPRFKFTAAHSPQFVTHNIVGEILSGSRVPIRYVSLAANVNAENCLPSTSVADISEVLQSA